MAHKEGWEAADVSKGLRLRTSEVDTIPFTSFSEASPKLMATAPKLGWNTHGQLVTGGEFPRSRRRSHVCGAGGDTEMGTLGLDPLGPVGCMGVGLLSLDSQVPHSRAPLGHSHRALCSDSLGVPPPAPGLCSQPDGRGSPDFTLGQSLRDSVLPLRASSSTSATQGAEASPPGSLAAQKLCAPACDRCL